MKELLESVQNNFAASVLIALVGLTVLAAVGEWSVRMVRLVTGKYPPPDPQLEGEEEQPSKEAL